VGVDKRNGVPPPLHLLPQGEERFFGNTSEGVRDKFSNLFMIDSNGLRVRGFNGTRVQRKYFPL
jgi:hypothetical protein